MSESLDTSALARLASYVRRKLAGSELGRHAADAVADLARKEPVQRGMEWVAAALPPLDDPPEAVGGGWWVADCSSADSLVLLGDLHGRWDRARVVLREADIIDTDGRWCAPEGTTLLQMGDLLDTTHPGGSSQVLDTLRALRSLEDQAERNGGSVVVLMGNHELDLLSGRFLWFARQKRDLLQQLGLDDHTLDAFTVDPLARAASIADTPMLSWLSRRPLVAFWRNLVAVHGGPTRELAERLDAADVVTRRVLVDRLVPSDARDFSDDSYAEGRSIFSPLRQRDDFVGDLDVLRPFLSAAQADWLAVGHSPFLPFDRDQWIDPADPAHQEALTTVARVGSTRQVLKLDTNLKRDGCAEVIRVSADGSMTALAPGRTRTLLDAGESFDAPSVDRFVLVAAHSLCAAVDGRREPTLDDLSEPGVDGALFDEAWRTFDARTAADTDVLRTATLAILRATPSDTVSLRRVLAGLRDGHARHATELVALHRELERRAVALAASVDLRSDVWRIFPTAADAMIGGVRYRLLEHIVDALWDRANAAGVRPRQALGGELVIGARDLPALRLTTFAHAEELPLADWTVLAPVSASGSWTDLETWARSTVRRAALPDRNDPPGPAPNPVTSGRATALDISVAANGDGVLTGPAFRALVACNAKRLDLGSDAATSTCGCERMADMLEPGWVGLRGPWTRLRALVTPDERVLLADTTFVDPGAEWMGVRRTAANIWTPFCQTEWLLDTLAFDRGQRTFFAHLRSEVARLLTAGEFESLLAGHLVGDAPWRVGAYLFAAATRTAASTFEATNPHVVSFQIDRSSLAAAIADGYVRLNLFVADAGETLDPAPPGPPDVAVELVAVGTEGVSWLWAKRASEE